MNESKTKSVNMLFKYKKMFLNKKKTKSDDIVANAIRIFLSMKKVLVKYRRNYYIKLK